MYVSGLEQGGVANIASLVDQQVGPTCGFEAVETVIQLHYPARDDISRTILPSLADRTGHLVRSQDGGRLEINGIRSLLLAFRIPCLWYAFDHQTLINALHEDRVAIAVVDAHLLDSSTYPYPKSWHAIVLTNYYLDRSGRFVVGYVGADSNFAGQERAWPYDSVCAAAMACATNPLLITERPVKWAGRADHYQLDAIGRVMQVHV
jgi:hypothetical protein